MTKPDKPAPAAKRTREPATWTVFEREVVDDETYLEGGYPMGTVLLVQRAENVVARTGADACWAVAEDALRDRAQSATPPVLCASRNGTTHGLTEARPYALKATVERVR